MLALGCGHASRAPAGRRPPPNGPSPRASGSDASATAAQLSEETRALLRAEGDLLWTRWTTGSGPLPASALAEHPRLLQRESIDTVSAAAARSSGSDAVALGLLSQQLATLAVSREAGAEIDALERARSQLAFPAPGDTLANHGVRVRVRRAGLPRLARTALADPQFTPGKAWPTVRDVLALVGAPPPPGLRVDAEPSPSKGARPLALLVDPPADVRLSLRPAGGFEEQRATLHEGARAVGGTLIDVPRWELAQLGDGCAAEAVALLFESLAGHPEWLRATTQLRGEPLDDMVHTEATRRLLAARRAAALVLFEIRRREGPGTPEAQAALYRGLLQRALFVVLTDDDAGRWALEAESSMRSVTPLVAAVLAAQLEQSFGASWWTTPRPALKQIWAGGRSLRAVEAARAFGLTQLDPAALAAVADERLHYSAPDAPPAPPKPDYKYMQGDKKKRRRKR